MQMVSREEVGVGGFPHPEPGCSGTPSYASGHSPRTITKVPRDTASLALACSITTTYSAEHTVGCFP